MKIDAQPAHAAPSQAAEAPPTEGGGAPALVRASGRLALLGLILLAYGHSGFSARRQGLLVG